MRSATGARELDEQRDLYESLARYQWLKARLSLGGPGAGLEMHKSLSAPATDESGPGAGLAPLHDWLLDWLQPPPAGTVLDVGCGFGATLLHWAGRRPGRQVGLCTGTFQVDKASAEARRLGLADRCEFRLQSYDDPVAGSYCAAIAVEALFHSRDLERTMRNLARCLEPGGRILLLEDLAANGAAAGDPDAVALLRRWSTLHMYTVSDFREALHAAGFEGLSERDLTAQVRHRSPRRLAAAERRLLRLHRLSPLASVRRLCDAFLGGISLERLYARGLARYVAILAELPRGSGDAR